MSDHAPNRISFAERYCERFSVNPADFEAHLLRQALYPAARALGAVVSLKNDFFIPDREFVRAAGRLTDPRKFYNEAEEFFIAPENRAFLRRHLRLRVSVRRMKRLVRSVFG